MVAYPSTMAAEVTEIRTVPKRPKSAPTRAPDTDKRASNLASAMDLFRTDPAIRDLVAYDDMLCMVMLMRPVPAQGRVANDFKPRPIKDTDVSALQEWFQRNGLKKIGRDTAHQAVESRAQERSITRSRTISTASNGTVSRGSRHGSPPISAQSPAPTSPGSAPCSWWRPWRGSSTPAARPIT